MKLESYPDYVVKGVKDHIGHADAGLLTTYTGIRDMLKHGVKDDHEVSKIESTPEKD